MNPTKDGLSEPISRCHPCSQAISWSSIENTVGSGESFDLHEFGGSGGLFDGINRPGQIHGIAAVLAHVHERTLQTVRTGAGDECFDGPVPRVPGDELRLPDCPLVAEEFGEA